MRALLIAALCFTAGAAPAAEVRKTMRDYGVSGSDNCAVVTPVKDFIAYRIAKATEKYRQELATDLLGYELPDGKEHACINVFYEEGPERGKVLLAANDDRSHMIFITVPHDEDRIWPLLKHEISHCVLNARFPKGMPVWASEGLCSRYDGPEDKQTRKAAIKRMCQRKTLPPLHKLLDAPYIYGDDVDAYAVAESVTEFLMGHCESAVEFVDFVEDGQRDGWDSALRKHFQSSGIRGVTDLQAQWKKHVESNAENH